MRLAVPLRSNSVGSASSIDSGSSLSSTLNEGREKFAAISLRLSVEKSSLGTAGRVGSEETLIGLRRGLGRCCGTTEGLGVSLSFRELNLFLKLLPIC